MASDLSLPLLVVLHDVAPPFLQPIRTIVARLRELVGSRFACAVVPRWHGRPSAGEFPALRDAIGECEEWLLHGWTHCREHRSGLISHLTGRADELTGLCVDAIQQRIDRGLQELAGQFASEIRGFVPPAWQLPVAAAQLSGLTYVMRYRRLEPCRATDAAQRLVTWSYDWGRLHPAAWGGRLLGTAQWYLTSPAVPCIVLHPMDLGRGWLPDALRLIRCFLDEGREPVTPGSLMATTPC